ncbi:G-alpha-domain-containing protein [Phellopilus nigrolimitatus]|nr:G-alpha-domain-containing protein [Phellopilus nigrolimitatus]
MGRSLDIDDPLTAALAPPPDETPAQRAERERREAHARHVNDEIDELLRAERLALKKKRRPVKVLLLGQSESGKSTTLKNFQLAYARNAWQEERASWRAVVQLNLLRSVNLILDVLQSALAGSGASSSAYLLDDVDDDDATPPPPPAAGLALSETHKLLRLRLAPLRRVQADLERRLGSGAEEPVSVAGGPPTVAAPFDGTPAAGRRPQEFYVRSSTGWKSALDRLRPRSSSAGSREEAQERARRERDAEESTAIIAGCCEDMHALWTDSVVRQLLTARRLHLEDSAGFFLDDVQRVATHDYEPSDDDIVRARLRTMGVQEYHFLFERGAEAGQEWLMYDVGGTRSLRQAWAPFFDDINAIIFLAPISAFDEKLAEDRRVNRLEDSFLLWKAVCANRLLAKTQLVLFLNKCDLLGKKLAAGVQMRDYVPSFGDRSNTSGTVAKYLRTKFRDMSKNYSPEPRPIYTHLTSVIVRTPRRASLPFPFFFRALTAFAHEQDTKATALTLGAVREGILREHLRGADFL